MPLDLGPNLIPEINKLHSTGRWVWLFDVNVGAGSVYYLANHDSNISWNSTTYYAAPVEAPALTDAQGTQIPTIELTVYQIDQGITDRLRDGELQGQTVTMRLVHTDHLSDTTYHLERTAEILTAAVHKDRVVFTLGGANWLTKTLGRRFLRLRCHHVYGSEVCGYDLARTGALATCARTFDDCVMHGDDEAADGLYRLHPMRFGGFKPLPRVNRG